MTNREKLILETKQELGLSWLQELIEMLEAMTGDSSCLQVLLDKGEMRDLEEMHSAVKEILFEASLAVRSNSRRRGT